MKYGQTSAIAVLLLAASLLSTAMVSCGGDTGNDSKATDVATVGDTASVTVSTEELRTPHALDLNALDFGGEELNQVTFEWQGYRFYFFADEETGDVMNDALYNRTRTVEEALNIDIVTDNLGGDDGTYVPAVRTFILSGEDVYDLMFSHCIDGISMFAFGGYLYNLDTLPHINMDAEWWNKEKMDVLRLGQNTYYAVNDMMIPCPYVIFFNKDMVANLDLENPYQLVYDGKWTLDVMETMAREAVADVNGDGKMDANDSWGITAREISKYISFMAGADQYITDRDDNGRIQLALNTEKTQSMVVRFEAMTKDNVIYMPPSPSRTDMLTLDTGRLMFQLDSISDAELLRDFSVDFGFLPYPKYDEAQSDYISLDWGGLLSVPVTITNPDLVGASLELIAWESKNEVIPTYYDTILQGKLARDDDAVKMMDILFDTVTYEIGGNYFGFSAGFGDLFYALPRLAIEQKSSDFASYYKKREKTAMKTIESFYEALDTVENS